MNSKTQPNVDNGNEASEMAKGSKHLFSRLNAGPPESHKQLSRSATQMQHGQHNIHYQRKYIFLILNPIFSISKTGTEFTLRAAILHKHKLTGN
jgi:hypothetical protein